MNNLLLFLDNVEVKNEIIDGTIAKRKTTVSTIKFSARSGDNQASYACEAVHGGLRGQSKRANFMLSVQCKYSNAELFYIRDLSVRQ